VKPYNAVAAPPVREAKSSRRSSRASVADALLAAAKTLSESLGELRFDPPVAHVYDPHRYAWGPYEQYVRRFGDSRKKAVLLGMNPGPFGMTQTGVPFGEIAAVRDWMRITAPAAAPEPMHPKRPIEGFACTRSEVSGRRLWGWAAERFGGAGEFFTDWFVLNYCPLVFLEESGRNLTPDKLPAAKLAAIHEHCDRHLAAALSALSPQWAIGVGAFAEKRLNAVLNSDLVDGEFARSVKIASILHPSPASPAANRGWTEAVDKKLSQLGLMAARR